MLRFMGRELSVGRVCTMISSHGESYKTYTHAPFTLLSYCYGCSSSSPDRPAAATSAAGRLHSELQWVPAETHQILEALEEGMDQRGAR